MTGAVDETLVVGHTRHLQRICSLPKVKSTENPRSLSYVTAESRFTGNFSLAGNASALACYSDFRIILQSAESRVITA
ncbi:hypothetical protein V2J09_001349 [Rumex salicifolius]